MHNFRKWFSWYSPREEWKLFVHNLVIHPAMGFLYVLGLKDLGDALHDTFLPVDEER